MSLVGRQRSSTAAAHHHRQYSDNFLDSSSSSSITNKWLQSSPLQEFGGGRFSRNNDYDDITVDMYAPPQLRSSSLRMMNDYDDVFPKELSPGLLDLHSFDTELLPEMSVPSPFERSTLHHVVRGQIFKDSDPYLSNSKSGNKSRAPTENSLLKSFSADKEKTNNVAKIKVVVRKRPLNKKEISKKEEDIITIEPNSNYLTVHETKLKVDLTEYVEKHDFVFDAVLNEGVSNEQVYAVTVEPIVPLIFHRTKATCFAYGQTGSGKTYTMQPLPLKASEDILRLIHYDYRSQGFQLFVSFFEIYGGKLFDLLSDRRKLLMREDGKQQVCIVGLQEYKVSQVELIKDLIEKGNAARSTGTTGANEESSRSHAILQLVIKRSTDASEKKPARLVGKLSFIDLAGSERGADTTDNDKQTRMEGAEINKSLLALKECIRALDNDQGHIPFRGSKLTEVLRDSFVGDSRTVMISCISPSSGSCEHTLNTLRYADRVKSLSKGSSSKKDTQSSYSNLRDSMALPLSSTMPTEPSIDDDTIETPYGKSRFGWQKQRERESSPPIKPDHVPSRWAEDGLIAPVSPGYRKSHVSSRGKAVEDDIVYSELTHLDEKRSWSNNTEDEERIGNKLKERSVMEIKIDKWQGDEDLNALLKEEEDLVIAHRKQVEETIDIVREEMDLLVEVDQPGNQLDDYILKLNIILSQKAAGIVQLQTRLANFQRRLSEHNVLVSSGN